MPANKDKNRAGASASAASAPAASDFPAGAKLSWDDWLALFRGWAANASGLRRIPIGYTTPNGHRLGRWQENQRQAHKRKTLASERVKELEAAGMVWDLRSMLWEEAYLKFLEYPADGRGKRNVAVTYLTG